MKKRILSGILAFILFVQVFALNISYAKDNKHSSDNLVKIGELSKNNYPKIDSATLLRVAKEERNKKKGKRMERGATLFSAKSPYINGQQPADPDKPKYWANVQGELTTRGIDGTTFDWDKVLGKGQKVKLLFTQTNGNVMTGVTYTLLVDKGGTYTWHGSDGKPTYLPLYDVNGNPYTYNVQIERNYSKDIQLVIQESNGTPGVSWKPEGDKQVATISFLNIKIQQVASTKFVSEWHTDVNEADRPQIEGYFKVDDETDNKFNFPKNDTTRTVLRSSFLENFEEDEDNGPWSFLSSELETTPKTVEVKTDTQGLTFKEKDGVKTVKSGDHKFKYDFKYDVINGGKLTMTEVIPVTFDANGGKFADFTAPDTEKQIVKEVDYDGTLTDKAEEPKKERETFKGWGIKDQTSGKLTPVKDSDFLNIKEAKTFYAIWDNNDIVADQLEVKESFKDGTVYVNDFIPTLDQLKGQVKIKDANGDSQALETTDTFEILNDSGDAITGDALKDYLYEKLREKANPKGEPTRLETVRAKITHKNGTTQTVDIPIKVIKNIYEAKTLTEKPYYVPDDYVKVTLDPTTKAKDPQKTYYYVNPKAKVVIPGKDPKGTDGNVFTKWLIDGTDTEYKLAEKPRYKFSDETTIKAQYDKEKQGIVKIAYVDENKQPIDPKYHVDGQKYPSEKFGKLGASAEEGEFVKQGPAFNGYIGGDRAQLKSEKYKNPAEYTVTYQYYKKVTIKEPTNKNIYFPVIFDANEGKFESDPKDKKTVYVYFDGNNATVEKVTFKEVKDEFDKAYKNPTKDGFDFKEWQNAKTDGIKPADDYEIQFKDWDWDADPDNGYVPETFYAHYGKASALVKYLELGGESIADKYKIDGVDYPTEKDGKLDEAIRTDVYTKDTAPKFIGYKFNRIELNPADGKYSLDKKATIKIYYEKLADVIPDTTPEDDSDKPEGYVTVKFLPGDNGSLTGTTKFYVNPKSGKKNSDLTEPTIKANIGYKVADQKWDPKFDTETVIKEDKTYTAQYTDGTDVIPVPDPTNPPEKPEGYVTVKFDLDGKGTSTDTKEFYVNPNKEVEITAPTVTGINNYSQKTGADAWSPTFATKAKYAKDKTFVAQYTFGKDIIPQKPGENKPVVPDNYVKVEFKKGDHGLISSEETTIYWVNPDKEVDLTDKAPKVVANAEYKHTGWDKVLKDTFKNTTVITAQYKKKVETTNPNDTENYVKVDFVAEKNGSIKAGETATYWVLKDETVELKTPAVEAKANYAFKAWNPEVKTSYSQDITHKAVFAYTGDNVVPQKPGEDKPDVPDDFVKVIYNQGTNGTIDANATTTYWVNPKVKVTVTAPQVNANDDYKHMAWTYGSKEETNLESVTDSFKAEETTITAKYLKKVLEDEPKTDKDAYVKVTFKSETNGKLAGDNTEKSYWVLKDTPVSLTPPSVTANNGYKFIKYDPEVQTSYNIDTTHKAQYKKIIETKDPKDKDYVKVSFDAAKQGTIKAGSNAEVWVLKDETIDPTAITPELEVKEKYAFEKWDPAVQTSYSEDTKHTASYTYNGDDVVPQKPGENKPNVPDNFVKVTFVAGDHGSIANTETNIFWVNPEKQVTLTAPNLVANKGYKHMAWTYGSKEETNLLSVKDTFTEKETTITAKYLKKVLEDEPETDKDAYVKVTFKSEANGKLAGDKTEKSYWVLKNTDVSINGPNVSPNSGFSFTEWSPAIKTNYDADTTHTAQYKSKDKVLTQDPKDSDYIKVIFNANGGKIGLDNSKDLWVLKGIATFADAKAKVADPTKVNSTFKGWQDKVSEGNQVKDTKVLNTDGETFYAAWTDKGKIIEDPSSDTPDPDYVRLTFDATADGKIGDTDKTSKVIDVLKGTPYTDKDLKDVIGKIKAVPNNAEKAFDKWTPAVPTTGFVDTATFVASYADYKNIIPYDPKDPMARPDGYVKVTFKAENGLNLTEEKAYYVKKNAGIKLGNAELVKPAYEAQTGYKFDKWDKEDSLVIEATDIVVTAKATKLDNVIPEKDEHGKQNEKPEGYITVTFSAEENGKLKGTSVYYVNPDKAVVLQDKAPEVTPNTGFDFAGWDISIAKAIKYNDGDVIKARYNEKGDVIPQEKTDGTDKPAGYLTVTFDKGDHGELSGKTVYYVKPNKEVTVPAPTVTPNTGFEFEKWDKELTQTFKEDTTITAQYKKSTGTTPGDNPGGTTPGDKPGDKPGDNPGGTTPGDKPGDKPGDNPGGTTPGGTTPGTNPETPGENPETPGTVPENPGAIPGTKPGVVEKHGNRYVERVAGKNRVRTAINTSNRFFKKSKYVIIADSGNYPDALTATVLAHVLDCPILLNNTRYLEDDVAREIVRLGASEVIIVGGHKSISENVKSQLAKYDQNKVQRIWGRDRYVTSSELAYEIERLTGKVNKAIIASGENFPDALATAPLGSKEIAPILLVTRNQMDKKVSKALKDLNIKRVYVAGGQNSVSKKLEAQLPQVIRRFSGQDRYETAILVASYTYPESKEVFVASGETFPDALVIGPVCARRKAPILLSKSTPVKSTDDYIEKSKIEYLYIIGGTNTIHVDTAHKYAIED
ncbi:cell wall-binding repeat-containing protein [Finegoldia magna]|nr:cell wall-binding repeat-containing protein [Finegoldia magna]UEA69562.1 cell wall-binding repeat-containing protein [Finegoldia magna]